MGVPLLWNIRSPSEPLSSNTLISFGLLIFLLLVLDFLYLDLLEDFFGRPDVVTNFAYTAVTPFDFSRGEFEECLNWHDSTVLVRVVLIGLEELLSNLCFLVLRCDLSVQSSTTFISSILPDPSLQALSSSPKSSLVLFLSMRFNLLLRSSISSC